MGPIGRRWRRLTKTVALFGRGAQVLNATGLRKAIGPRVALKMAKDMRKGGRRGALAMVHLHALSDPLRPALVSDAGRYNYGEFEQRINRLTHGLRSLGVGPGVRVGAFLHNSGDYLEINAALAAVGGVSVQVGHRLKPPEVAHILENSGARSLFFHAELVEVAKESLALLPSDAAIALSDCIVVGAAPGFRTYDDLLASGDPANPAIVEGGGFGGIMVYTSGTTGRSKGASRDFRRMGVEPILNFISQFPLSRDERHLVICPLYHSAASAFVSMIVAVGGCSVIAHHFDPEETLQSIERERITSMLVVPTMLARILALPRETLRRYDLSSLRWIMSGAAPLPTEVARKTEDQFGPILYNFYGATETGLVTIAKPGEHTARPGTIGQMIKGNQIRLLDADGRDVPDGQVGELYVRNAMMMDGYHKNPEATSAASREGFISVGDLAYRDADGYYYLADRKTDMVISGGVNIYPWEIEQRLHQHRAVADVAVVGVPDPEWGESLVAYVVRRPGQTVSAEELSEHVRLGLADYKRPKQYHFVESLPRTPTGKILKRELKMQASQKIRSA